VWANSLRALPSNPGIAEWYLQIRLKTNELLNDVQVAHLNDDELFTYAQRLVTLAQVIAVFQDVVITCSVGMDDMLDTAETLAMQLEEE
jgi:hypothetical protein